MADSYEVQRGCASKTRYSTQELAAAVAVKVYNLRAVELRVYECDQGCGGFHLTHQRAQTSYKPGWREPKISQRMASFVDERRDKRRRGRRGDR